jgi:hypothetical protein
MNPSGTFFFESLFSFFRRLSSDISPLESFRTFFFTFFLFFSEKKERKKRKAS